MKTSKRKTRTKILEPCVNISCRVPLTFHKKIVAAAKKENVYISDFIKICVEQQIREES